MSLKVLASALTLAAATKKEGDVYMGGYEH